MFEAGGLEPSTQILFLQNLGRSSVQRRAEKKARSIFFSNKRSFHPAPKAAPFTPTHERMYHCI